MPHPDLFWYRLNGMGAKKVRPKSSFEETLFLYIFHVKTKSNIVYEYLRTKIFSRDTNILPQTHWISYFWTLSYNHWGVLSITKLSNPNFKKTVCPKKRLDAALKGTLMQIWKSPYMFVFILKQYPEDAAFLIWIPELFSGQVCKFFKE